jgi:hypothetical protein
MKLLVLVNVLILGSETIALIVHSLNVMDFIKLPMISVNVIVHSHGKEITALYVEESVQIPRQDSTMTLVHVTACILGQVKTAINALLEFAQMLENYQIQVLATANALKDGLDLNVKYATSRVQIEILDSIH